MNYRKIEMFFYDFQDYREFVQKVPQSAKPVTVKFGIWYFEKEVPILQYLLYIGPLCDEERDEKKLGQRRIVLCTLYTVQLDGVD